MVIWHNFFVITVIHCHNAFGIAHFQVCRIQHCVEFGILYSSV